MGLHSSKRLTSPGVRPILDCQRLRGPESDISSEEGGGQNPRAPTPEEGGQNPRAPTPEEPCEQRGRKEERLEEVEIRLLPRKWLRQDLEWKQIL